MEAFDPSIHPSTQFDPPFPPNPNPQTARTTTPPTKHTETTHTRTYDSVTVPLVAPGEASQYIGCWQLEGTDPERGERLSIGNRCVRALWMRVFGVCVRVSTLEFWQGSGTGGVRACVLGGCWGFGRVSLVVAVVVVVGEWGSVASIPSISTFCTHVPCFSLNHHHRSIWVDIQVEDPFSSQEWEVVTAPTEETEEEEEEEEEEEAAVQEVAAETTDAPAAASADVAVAVAAAAEQEEEEGDAALLEAAAAEVMEQGGKGQKGEDEAWGRWKEELACLAEMGFETRLDACVAALERLRPTDAEVGG
jgi:hypothetical protein